MKVLHVIDALGVGGGAEHSLVSLLPLLRDRGIDSSVVVLHSSRGGLQDSLSAMDFGVIAIDATSRIGRIRELRRLIQSGNYEIVHATLLSSCVTTRIANISSNILQINSLVSTRYDPAAANTIGIAKWRLPAVRIIDRLTARYLGGHFHVLTKAVAKEAIEVLGITEDRITRIPRGRSEAALRFRDSERSQACREALGFTTDAPVIVNIGRQDLQKGQETLIRAFAVVRETFSEATLLLAGREGNASKKIKAAISQTGVADSVRLLGNRDDVADLLAAADVFVFPSEIEGLGCSLLEAMAVGAPIIGSDATGIAEVLENGKYGVIVPRGDAAALADAIIELLSDPIRREELSTMGRAKFLESYELDHIADLTAQMYFEVARTSK